MSNNEALIREIAEEMACANHPISFQLYNKYKDREDNGWSHDFYVKNWPIIIESYLTQARIAVNRMADIHETGFRTGLRFANSGKGETRAKDLLNKGLISEDKYNKIINEPKIVRSGGLIPDQEAGQDV